MERFANKLGSPDIKMAGLQVWVHGRQFPEATDYWDGNWVRVTVHCGAKGSDVWASGPIIHLPEILGLADACERMSQTLSGEASLDCMEPELSIKLQALSLGHLLMTVAITPDHLNQSHTFQFEIDQSHLSNLIAECRQTLMRYPIKNPPE